MKGDSSIPWPTDCELPEDELECGPDIKERQPWLLIRDEMAQIVKNLKNNKGTGKMEKMG